MSLNKFFFQLLLKDRIIGNVIKFLYSYVLILMCFKHVGRSGFV